MTLKLSLLTKEFVKTQVTHTIDGEVVDPTTSAIQWAFMDSSAAPTEPDWVTGDWETTSDGYYARCLIGPGSANDIGAGTYKCWIRITDTPERPVRMVGTLVIS